MKIVGIIALVLGMAFGSTAFARDHGDHGAGTHGIGTECWMEQERSQWPVEVCGTIFPGAVEDDEYADRR
jgi:hypothetical protein|tara:strand:- start:7 stop:216 length:210 start_codon:yes stop_codon:yes gene_type:complete